MDKVSMIGYFRAQAPFGSGFRASVQDAFPFWDVLSAATSFAAAQKRAGGYAGKVVSFFGPMVGQAIRQQYASIEPVGKGIGEWEPELEVVS